MSSHWVTGVWFSPNRVTYSAAFSSSTVGANASQERGIAELRGTHLSTMISSRPCILGIPLKLTGMRVGVRWWEGGKAATVKTLNG